MRGLLNIVFTQKEGVPSEVNIKRILYGLCWHELCCLARDNLLKGGHTPGLLGHHSNLGKYTL